MTTVVLVALGCGLHAAAKVEPIRVDHRRQLFLDDEIIASMTRVKREIHPAAKHPANPLIWPDQPWESKTSVIYGSVIRDGDTYRMWYHSEPGVSYAESDDGIRWIKPQRDLVTLDGCLLYTSPSPRDS